MENRVRVRVVKRAPRQTRIFVAAVTVAAAVGAGTAGCRPTGYRALDIIYCAAAGGLLTLAGAKANRAALLVAAAVAFALTRSWMLIPAGAGLGLALYCAFLKRPRMRLGALVGALVGQAVLRWPHVAFHGLTALVATAVGLVVLAAGWWELPGRPRRWLAWSGAAVLFVAGLISLPIVATALVAKGNVDQGESLARAALDRIDAGDAPDAVHDLRLAADDLGRAHSRTSPWWTAGANLVPVAAQQRRSIVAVTGAGRRLAASAAGEAASIDFHRLAVSNGGIDLGALTAMSGPVGSLDAQIADARRVIARARSTWLVSPIAHPLAKLQAQLVRAGQTADLADQALRAAPTVLGAKVPKHYFVAFMTPAETRGLGGFLGAYAELTVYRGRISLTRSGRPIELVPPGVHPVLGGPASFLERYGSFQPQTNVEDSTYSPDLPTVASVVGQLYPQVGGDHLDGVLALDPYALAALLRLTGPVSVTGFGQPLDSGNAAQVLLRQQYIDAPLDVQQATRHDLLQEALSAGFQRLLSGSLPAPNQVASQLDPVVRQGRLLFWTVDPEPQALLRRVGLEGAFPRPGPSSDVLAVTVANAGNNKIDAYLTEKITDRVQYDPGTGRAAAQLTISLHNGAPATGLPPYVIGSFPGSGLAPGTNYMWLSLYSPLRVSAATVDGQPLALSNPIPELGVLAYSGYVSVPSSATAVVSVRLSGLIQGGRQYRLALRTQPLANPTSVSVSVAPVGKWQLAAPPDWRPGTDAVQAHQWRFRP